MFRLRVAALLLPITCLAACGGSSDPVAKASSCLAAKGLQTSADGKLSDNNPTVHLQVYTAQNHAEISFGRDKDFADLIELGQAPRAALNGVALRRHGNAVVLWDRFPTDDEAQRVEGCLS